MITSEEIQREKDYLKNVISVLKEEIETYDSKVKSLSNNIQEQMSYAWDKTNRLSDTEFVYALANIQKRSVYAENANKKVTSYRKMLNNAYFARIDFDDGEETLPIYIGIASLEHGDDFLVFDWRAPISSMFYNNEVGNASYTISTGDKITGKITLKRQYKISGGEIKEVFDTDMQIIDNVLKQMLSANASNKMKNIVNTIQKEQNQIIRKNDVDILIVQGPAGSGKTSIAMHKIAYLLYSERDKINNSNVMILSPNEIFNNYISDVLPDIGEDNVCQATYYEFAKAFINEFQISSKIEDAYEIVYASNSNKNNDKFNELKFKFDPIYTQILEDYIEANKIELMSLEPIEIGEDTIMTLSEMETVANRVKNEGESLYARGKKIIERIFLAASMKTQKQLTLEKIKKQAIENLVKIKLKAGTLYRDFYSDENKFVKFVTNSFKKYGREKDLAQYNLKSIFALTNESLSNDHLEFQDVTPFMFLKSRLIGIGANKNIRYVLIDEAQDYSIAQYKILSMLFKNANITLLGDINQSILPFNKINDYNGILDTIKTYKPNVLSEECELSKTYRSTYEINEYAKQVIPSRNTYTQVDRHGDPVIIHEQSEFDPEEIIERAINLKSSYNTVAIVCKNLEETLLYNQVIQSKDYALKFRMVTKNDNVFVGEKIMVIPSYLAKGLEFDAVLVSNASDEFYGEPERNLFYVVLTRALHKLEIFYAKKFTNLISGATNEKNNG
ncbi:MAG: UvrD-helicase domain-containing protein [Clostridia bacterium]|nr:UvrD-helicase domain-containing protein [Clostridia bacterium]